MRLVKLFVFVSLLGGLGGIKPSSAGEQKIVTCTATTGLHCTRETGCEPDATYVTTYRVDLKNETVQELTVQHTKRDPKPVPGTTTYAIVRSVPSTVRGNNDQVVQERSITAVGLPGNSAAETILIGETQYLSSSVSSLGTRIQNMMGFCKGF